MRRGGRGPGTLIVEELKRAGIRLVASLPDEWLKELLDLRDKDPHFIHVPVSREDEGVGVCAGYQMGGGEAALIVQNTGLFLSANAIIALINTFRIPLLMLVSNRGDIDDAKVYQVPKALYSAPLLDALHVARFEVKGPEDAGTISKAHTFSKLSQLPVAVLLSRRALVGP